MKRIYRGSKRRKTPLLTMALVGVLLGVLIGGGSFVSAAKGPSVADYSQCANGAFVAGASDPTTDCDAWINGILNPNNSQYREDQVTAQRLFVDGLPAGHHSYDFQYLVRKADGHAYDSLATWNTTQTTADPCQGLNGPSRTACDTLLGDPANADTLPIDPDPLVVDSACTTESTTTSEHQLPGQVFTMFGGDLTDMTYTGTASDSEGLYQKINVEFDTTGSAHRVYLLFGGHLAASLTPDEGSPRGWGDNCGASSISGGPYHIKLDGIDGASAGNRDNQIMSNAVLPLIIPSLSTQPTASATTSGTVGDSLTIANGANAGGTATFKLYPTLADCHGDTNALSTETKNVVAGSATATNVSVSPTSNTTYYWKVNYSGDPANNFAPGESACGAETATVNVATTSVFPVPSP